MVASDKLFFWLFQNRTDRLQPLVEGFLTDMEGYTFTAPVIKEREVRLDGLFLPPTDQLQDKFAVIMEAQMAPDPEFFLRIYSGSSLLLQHQSRQDQPVRFWRVLVICPSRDLNFGDSIPVAEFLRERVIWIELAPDRLPPDAPPCSGPWVCCCCRRSSSRRPPPPSVCKPAPLPCKAESMT